MTADDIPAATRAILADDWGDRRAWFEFVVGHPSCRAVVAEVDGEIVGTGVTTVNGPVAWIGTIWVAPAWRRGGLGTALTGATIEEAEAASARTLLLVATEAGRPLYEGLGFEVQSWYVTLEAPGVGAAPAATMGPPRLRAFDTADLASMASLDRAATGEDRGHLLSAFASPASARVLDGRDGIAGFVVRAPWGGGATIAPAASDAAAILQARRVAAGPGRRVRAGLLAENTAGLAVLGRQGWTEAWRAPRLIRGDPLDWQPTHIWGQFNHALG
jgi:ribosomal protein S18 acetylase RimI-like enzyme